MFPLKNDVLSLNFFSFFKQKTFIPQINFCFSSLGSEIRQFLLFFHLALRRRIRKRWRRKNKIKCFGACVSFFYEFLILIHSSLNFILMFGFYFSFKIANQIKEKKIPTLFIFGIKMSVTLTKNKIIYNKYCKYCSFWCVYIVILYKCIWYLFNDRYNNLK